MNVLPDAGPEPVGAVALLAFADSEELARFHSLEDAVWKSSTLSPSVIESVRLRCAHVRRCASCSAVRISAAADDGLSEAQIATLDTPETRRELSEAQQAALDLADRFLLDPNMPEPAEARRIARVLGSRGVMEVLLACAVFSSSELRMALGEDRAADGNVVVERETNEVQSSASTQWPALDGPVLDPQSGLEGIAPELACAVGGRITTLWSSKDLPKRVVAACVRRSMQLLGVAREEPVAALLVPEFAAGLPGEADVRNWPNWPPGLARSVLALAELLWLDPSKVDEATAAPLIAEIGVDGLIRVTWTLVWIRQLHRFALVLHRGR